METLKLIVAVIAGAAVATSAVFILIVVIRVRTTAIVKEHYDCEASEDLAEYEASLSGLSVEMIKQQHKDMKRGVKK